MSGSLQIAAIVVSVSLLGLVLELVRRKRLTEEYSFVWIVCALALLVLAIQPKVLDRAALAVGIHYPPAALVLVLILFVFIASVSFSVVISRHRQQIERLVEHGALLEAQVRTLSEELGMMQSQDNEPRTPERLSQG